MGDCFGSAEPTAPTDSGMCCCRTGGGDGVPAREHCERKVEESAV